MSTDELHAEPSPVEGRLIDAHCLLLADPEPQAVAYNHTIFCQTSLPFRNPGDDVREVTRVGRRHERGVSAVPGSARLRFSSISDLSERAVPAATA